MRRVVIFELILLFAVLSGPSADAIDVDGRVETRDSSRPDVIVRIGDVEVRATVDEISRSGDIFAYAWRCRLALDGVAPGLQELQVTATDSFGRARQRIPVQVGPKHVAPNIAIDRPSQNTTVENGTIDAAGWAYDSRSSAVTGVTSVVLLIDPMDAGAPHRVDATYGDPRPDVALGLGQTRFTPTGWHAKVNLEPGEHLIIAEARSNVTGDSGFAFTRIVVGPPTNTTPDLKLTIARPSVLENVWASRAVRWIGVASVIVAILLTLLMYVVSVRVLATTIALLGTAAGAIAMSFVDPRTVRSPFSELTMLWPRLDATIAWTAGSAVGLQGSLAAGTVGFLVLPAAMTLIVLAAESRRFRGLLIFVATVATLVIVASGSRAVMAGELLGILSYFLIRRGASVKTILAIVLAVIGASTIEVVVTDPDYGPYGRLEIWRLAISHILASPLAPGFGTFAQLPVLARHPHSTAIEIAIDFGVFAFAAAAVLAASSIRSLRSAATRNGIASKIGLAGVVALAVPAVTDSILTLAVPTETLVATVVVPTPLMLLAALHRRGDES